jgi:putative glutamine amidotransferase
MSGSRLVALMVGRSPEARFSVHRGYVEAVFAVGATPLIVASGPGCDEARVLELVSRCDGLILSGGHDIDPECYGQARGQGEKDLDPVRDQTEIAVYRDRLAAGRPVLGICRGIQLMAVADGGTLIPDLPAAGFDAHEDEERETEPVHEILAETGSAALRVLGGTTKVNSIHHQAVRTTGDGLRPTAWGPDGVIEAVEGPGLLGVQWHPERMWANDARHLAPFEWLVSA